MRKYIKSSIFPFRAHFSIIKNKFYFFSHSVGHSPSSQSMLKRLKSFPSSAPGGGLKSLIAKMPLFFKTRAISWTSLGKLCQYIALSKTPRPCSISKLASLNGIR